MRSPWIQAGACLLAVAGLACGDGTATQVLVRVDADETTRARAVRLVVRAFDVAGMQRYERAAEASFPATVPVVPRGGDASRRFELVAELTDAGGAVFARQRVLAGFVAGERRVVSIFFSADCNDMLGCAAQETCVAGACASACVAPAPEGEEAARVPCPVGDCAADGMPCAGGTCRGGECCTGCWNATDARCEAGDTLAACGAGGEVCDTCCADDVACETGACTPLRPVAEPAAGAEHACVNEDGRLWCWGANESGQTGDGLTADVPAPKRIGDRGDWGQLAAGTTHSCAIDWENRLWCWGGNAAGQIGTGDLDPAPAPVQILPGSTWGDVAAGLAHTCAVNRVGALWCWGQNADGIVGPAGFGMLVPTPTEIGMGTMWSDVDTFRRHACALAGTSLRCWGLNRDGALEVGSGDDGVAGPMPVTLDYVEPVVGFATGGFHTCTITQAMPGVPGGGIRCWGISVGGQLGRPPGALASDPIGRIEDFLQVSAGHDHACAIRADGSLWCWGRNGSGQVGSGTSADVVFEPERAGDRRDWMGVDAGGAFTCGVRAGGTLWCWGDNARGQLGIPGIPSARTPQRVCLPPP